LLNAPSPLIVFPFLLVLVFGFFGEIFFLRLEDDFFKSGVVCSLEIGVYWKIFSFLFIIFSYRLEEIREESIKII
jgi:hypothetical protein